MPLQSILHVPSGLTIRCANTFTNAGTIIVDAAGGSTVSPYYYTNVNLGIAKTAPLLTINLNSSYHPIGGKALPAIQLKAIFSVAPEGGGTGYPSSSGNSSPLGGGALRIVVQGALTNTGTIRAKGQNGESAINTPTLSRAAGGGGGGGIVILV